MRVEGPAGEADVPGTVVAEAAHEVRAPAHDAHREPAAERLTVGDQIRPHAEVLLRAAGGETEAHEDVVHDEDDAAARADGGELAEPVGVRRSVVPREPL